MASNIWLWRYFILLVCWVFLSQKGVGFCEMRFLCQLRWSCGFSSFCFINMVYYTDFHMSKLSSPYFLVNEPQFPVSLYALYLLLLLLLLLRPEHCEYYNVVSLELRLTLRRDGYWGLQLSILFFLMFIYLFILRKRENMCKWGSGIERESQAGSMLSAQSLTVGLISQIVRTWPGLNLSQLDAQLTEPPTHPCSCLF